MTYPKGTLPDHWTWRDSGPVVTGYHPKPKRGQPPIDPGSAPDLGPPLVVGPGLVTTSEQRAKSVALKQRQGKLL